MNNIEIEILTFNNNIIKDENISIVNLKTLDGPISILNNHISLITALDISVLSYKKLNEVEFFYVALGPNGIAEINNNKITIIVDTAEKKDDINIERAKKEKEKIEELLCQKELNNKKNIVILKYSLKKEKNRIDCFNI